MNAGPRYVRAVAFHDVEGPVRAHRHLHVVAGVPVQEVHFGVDGCPVSAGQANGLGLLASRKGLGRTENFVEVSRPGLVG